MALFRGIRWRLAQKLELRWWKSYLRQKAPSVYLENKRAYWLRVLHEVEWSPRPGDKILDAGCGPAGIFMVWDNFAVDACDSLMDSYAVQLPHFKQEWYPWVRFYNRAMEEGFPHPPYDYIACTNAINHVQHLELAIHQLAVSMITGGRLLISSDVHRWKWLKPVFRWLPGDALHPQQYDLESLIGLLEKQGFEVIRTHLMKRGLIFDYQFVVAQKVRSATPV